MSQETYIPIDCNFYDRLEAWAVTAEPVTIRLTGKKQLKGKITDLFVREHVEYLKLDNDNTIRLDEIKSVNKIKLPGKCDL